MFVILQYQAASGGMTIALAVVPSAGQYLSGLRSLRLLRREPVGFGFDTVAIGAVGGATTVGVSLGLGAAQGAVSGASAWKMACGVGGTLGGMVTFFCVLRFVRVSLICHRWSSFLPPPGMFSTLRRDAWCDVLASMGTTVAGVFCR